MTRSARDRGARGFQAMVLAAAVSVAVLAFPTMSRADTFSVDTTSSWNGTRTIGPFGYPDTTTYGQTVTVPAGDTQLSSFTFYVSLPSTLLFRGEVYAWDDTNHVATGTALYESPQTHTDASGVVQPVTFDTGGLRLVAGAKYVLFASLSKDYAADAGAGWGSWAYLGADVYGGGGFFFLNDAGDPGQWTSATWRGGPNDFVFRADFSQPDNDLAISGTPADVVTDATGPSGASVAYTMPTATDEDGPAGASVSCAPSPGSMFAIGTTTVNCTAADPDDSNGPVSSSFAVTVKGAPQQLGDLLGAVQGIGPGRSLAGKVVVAQSYLGQLKVADTCSILGSFTDEVKGQSGKSITSATAASLVASAQRVAAVLSC